MKAPKVGAKRVGSERCGGCHEIQLKSWSAGSHAKREPAIECENCHGPGSLYKKSAVMKDEERAKAAGLVKPTRDFCQRCHAEPWTDDLLKKVHEHGKVAVDEEEEE